MPSLTELTAVRGQRALRVGAHLAHLARNAAWDAPPWLRDRSLDDVYVEPDVSRWNREQQPTTVGDELREALAGGREADDRIAWAGRWPAITRAVVLGRPGEGKTTLLQRTCRAIAASSLALWEARTTPVDEIPVPIWLRAEAIIGDGSLSAALGVGLPGQATPPTGLLSGDLIRLMQSPGTWLFVDALDEWPTGARAEDVIAALASLRDVRAHIIASARTYAWPQVESAFRGFDVLELAPLTPAQRAGVVDRWCVGDQRRQLATVLDDVPMRELTSNALLLTLLCAAASHPARRISHDTRRVELYAWLVEDLVCRADTIKLDPSSSDAQDRVLALARAAWRLWSIAPGTPFTYQDWVDQLRVACTERGLAPSVFPELKREVERSGLLVTDGPRRRFFPQTAYEYLAGAGLVQDAALAEDEPIRIATTLARHAHDTAWREMSKLAIGHLAVIRQRGTIVEAIVNLSLGIEGAAPGFVPALLGEALIEAGEREPRPASIGLGGSPAALVTGAPRERLLEALLVTMQNADAPGTARHVPAIIRARAGTALGWLGDERFDGNPWKLPNDQWLGFLPIESSTFHMGSDRSVDRDAFDDEFPRHKVSVQRFLMARWPTTVDQFQVFCDKAPFTPGDARSLSDPPNHPVRYVSWHEALRYADWLTGQLRASAATPPALRALLDRGWVVTLPSEAEWEYAARGRDGRIYPYDGPFDPDRGNGRETGIRGPSPVGAFGRGKSPFGVEDLSGNLWEWTRSAYDLYRTSEGREDLRGEEPRVVRGGSFDHGPRLRSAYRYYYRPWYRDDYLGFRVVASPFALGL